MLAKAKNWAEGVKNSYLIWKMLFLIYLWISIFRSMEVSSCHKPKAPDLGM